MLILFLFKYIFIYFLRTPITIIIDLKTGLILKNNKINQKLSLL